MIWITCNESRAETPFFIQKDGASSNMYVFNLFTPLRREFLLIRGLKNNQTYIVLLFFYRTLTGNVFLIMLAKVMEQHQQCVVFICSPPDRILFYLFSKSNWTSPTFSFFKNVSHWQDTSWTYNKSDETSPTKRFFYLFGPPQFFFLVKVMEQHWTYVLL